MNRFLTPLLFGAALLLTVASHAQPTWTWANRAGSATQDDEGQGIAVDGAGNTYATGTFSGATTSFGTTPLVGHGGTDGYVAKYNSAGTLQWVFALGGTGDDEGLAIAVNAAGTAYVTGSFSGAASFGPLALNSQGDNDAFLISVSATGVFNWVQRVGGNAYDVGNGVGLDATGNCYVSGQYQLTANVSGLGNPLTSVGGNDLFIVSYTPAGSARWARSVGGTDYEYAGLLTVNPATGDYYLTGSFNTPFSFGAVNFPPGGNGRCFLVRYSAAGVAQWARQFGGSGGGTTISGVAVDATGACYVVGDSDAATIEFDALSVTNQAQNDGYAGYVARYRPNGIAEWAYGITGTENAGAYGVTIGPGGLCYVTGAFQGPVSFQGALGSTQPLSTTGRADLFVAQYNFAGELQQLASAGAGQVTVGQGIAVDGAGDMYVTGLYADSTRFGTTALPGSSSNDLFVARFGGPLMGVATEAAPTPLAVCPNLVTVGQPLRLQSLPTTKPATLQLIDALGRQVQSATLAVAPDGSLRWDVGALRPGVYTVRATAADRTFSQRIVIE